MNVIAKTRIKLAYQKPGPNAPPPPSEPKSPVDHWDARTAQEYAYSGIRYFAGKAVGQLSEWWYKLKESPKAKLEDPLLIVQGFNAEVGQFETLLEHLTAEGQNGGQAIFVNKGEFFSDPECKKSADVTPEHKVFRLVNVPTATPEQVSEDVALAVTAIGEASGDKTPDVVAHSMGGLSVRRFLDKGGKTGRFAMVGTPNQGGRAAMLTKSALVNGINWAISLSGAPVAAIPALEWMVPAVQGNQKLQALNARWTQQQENTEAAIVIGANDFATSDTFQDSAPGDGLIEASSLSLEGTNTVLLPGHGSKSHYTLMGDEDVFAELAKFFEWKLEAAEPPEQGNPA